MKLFLIIGGLFTIVFFCIIPLNRDIQEYYVEKNGKLVTASLTYIPNCSGTKIKYYMKFIYAGKEFDKRVDCGFASRYKVGDTINLKHKEGTDIFLFECEKIVKEFISTGLLAILGTSMIFIGIRKNR